MTEMLFRDDSYLNGVEAQVTGITPEGGILLDRTIFYATSGGQPGDCGLLEIAGGAPLRIETAIHPEGDKNAIAHVAAEGQRLPEAGQEVVCKIDWGRRHRLMRMHTALHLLSVVFPYPVTGGSIGEEKGRLDFNMPDVPDDKETLEIQLNALVSADHPVTQEWITDEEMAANPDLVKTMNVKPPMGQGRVRLIRIGTGDEPVDLQPCGGTHVARTGEIGPLRLGKIEKKGRENRRVNLFFAE